MFHRVRSTTGGLLLVVVLLGIPGVLFSQTALTGGLRGTVADAQGGPVPEAVVTLRNQELAIQQETKAGLAGEFSFSGLPSGSSYEVSIEALGFQPWRRSSLQVSSGDVSEVAATLELGRMREVITITDTFSTLPDYAPELSKVVDTRQLSSLPTNGRNLNRFALLNAHVRNASGLGADGFSALRLSINGNSFRDTQFKLDGNTNYDTLFNNGPLQRLSLSAVQEFKVLTNQFSAEQGETSAGYVLTTTKSGTDEFHGEVFFYGRPSGSQARPPLADRHVPNELLQYGGALGGPIVSGRTFFFANYERMRQNRGSFINSPAPAVFTGRLRDNLALVRIDHRINDNHWLALRVNGHRDTNNNVGDRVGGLVQPSAGRLSLGQAVGSQLTDTMTWGRLVNEFRASYVNAVPSSSKPLESSVTVIRPGYSTEGDSSFSTVRNETYQLSNQLSFSTGRHTLKFGGDFVRRKFRDTSFSEFGEYRFGPEAPGHGQNPLQFTQRFGVAAISYGQTRWAGFLQDDYRVLPRLTLNMGVRYEYQSIT
ncbi:MAG: TonB-dependent receptor, partial [Bryobacteraceae bacterium]